MHISTKCSLALHCLIFINEYGETKKVTGNLLSLSTGANPVTIRTIISSLKKSGIISVKSGQGGAKLSADPHCVSLLDICASIEPDFTKNIIGVHSTHSLLCPVGRNIEDVLNLSYDKIKDDLRNSLSQISLNQVFKNYKEIQKNIDIK